VGCHRGVWGLVRCLDTVGGFLTLWAFWHESVVDWAHVSGLEYDCNL
jgi:hypothetical protein